MFNANDMKYDISLKHLLLRHWRRYTYDRSMRGDRDYFTNFCSLVPTFLKELTDIIGCDSTNKNTG